MHTYTIPCPTLTREAILKEIGYQDTLPDGAVLALIDRLSRQLQATLQPQFTFSIFDGEILNERQIRLADTVFDTGATITHLLQHAERFALFAATAGRNLHEQIQACKQSDDILTSYVLDVLGTCIVEKTGDLLETALEQELNGLAHTHRLSPGYCNWPLTEQRKVFALLGGRPCGIDLSDVCLMTPVKSISGIIGIGKGVLQKQYACNYCELTTCYKRKR